MRVGDIIANKRNGTIWRVLEVLPDGKLKVKFIRGLRLPDNGQMERVISRPEDYRRI